MRYALLLLILIAMPIASAIGLTAHAPDENATVSPAAARFTFTAGQEYRSIVLEECDFILDGTVHKTIRINDKLGGASRQFTANVDDGTYEWRILCRTGDGSELWTPTRTVHLVTAEQEDVKTYSSGVIRGSLVHEFTMRNTAGAEPLKVPNVRPGDYLRISVEVPPSTITQEYFVRGKFVENGTPYLWLTHKQEDVKLHIGMNTTIPMQATTLVARLTGIEGTKSHIIFYPSVHADVLVNETTETNETEQEPIERPPAPPVQETPEEEPEEPEEPERQGFFSWVLSMLARLFGA